MINTNDNIFPDPKIQNNEKNARKKKRLCELLNDNVRRLKWCYTKKWKYEKEEKKTLSTHMDLYLRIVDQFVYSEIDPNDEGLLSVAGIVPVPFFIIRFFMYFCVTNLLSTLYTLFPLCFSNGFFSFFLFSVVSFRLALVAALFCIKTWQRF